MSSQSTLVALEMVTVLVTNPEIVSNSYSLASPPESLWVINLVLKRIAPEDSVSGEGNSNTSVALLI